MDQWLQLRSKYLRILLETEGRPSAPKCSICNTHGDIKCPDCFGAPVFCTSCCVEAHRHSPFHRPLQWTAAHYTPVSLHSLGFVLFIGHQGRPCPQTVEVCIYRYFQFIIVFIFIQGIKATEASISNQRRRIRHGTISSTSLPSIDEDEETPETNPQLPTPRETPQPDGQPNVPIISDTLFDHPEMILESSDSIPGRVYRESPGNRMLTVVDRSGIFEIEMVFCICHDEDSKDEQLLRSGLFPATFKSIKTTFTFSVLDDFLRDNLECKTTAQQYYSKLQSTTSRMFPNLVPVCYPLCLHLHPSTNEDAKNLYKQLLRVSRQWRDLKNRMEHGLGYQPEENIPDGSMAVFCPACPQPEVNLPQDWNTRYKPYVIHPE